MKRLPIGIQSFEKLRNDDYVYVDKTRLLYTLTHSGGSYFFLSRPRRFGKSLLNAFANDPRKLFKVAVSFNTGKRNIDEWKIDSRRTRS